MEQTIKGKLRAALAEMANPSKNQTAEIPTRSGGKFTYNYTTLDQVLGIVKPALYNHDLALRQCVTETKWYESEENLSGISYQLLTVVFDDNEELILDQRPYRPLPDAQQQGSFETYMRRYALMMAFGLAGEDDDGAGASIPQPTQQPNTSNEALAQFGALKQRLMAATGATEKDAADALINKVGDPRQMSGAMLKAALAHAEQFVSNLEKSNE